MLQKQPPFRNFVFTIYMLKRSRILKILDCTQHNYGGIMGGRYKIFKIQDRLSIEIAKTKFQKGFFFTTPFNHYFIEAAFQKEIMEFAFN